MEIDVNDLESNEQIRGTRTNRSENLGRGSLKQIIIIYLRAQIIFLPSFGSNTFSIPANNNAIIIIFFVTKNLSNIIFNFIAKFTIAYFTFKLLSNKKFSNWLSRTVIFRNPRLQNPPNKAVPRMTKISFSLPSILNHFVCWTLTSLNYFKVTDPSEIGFRNHKLS